MNIKPSWLRHGFWNTLEHAVTRGADAFSTLVLLWALAPETFARLAFAQAVVAPTLLFFIAIEPVIYRDYARWQAEGPSVMASRLHALRVFSWGKGQAALVLSLVLAFALPSVDSWSHRVFAVLWAYSLVLAPQLGGADREFLRLDLKLRQLNAVTLYQKLSLLVGTVAISLRAPHRIDLLAAVAAFSAISTGLLNRHLTLRELTNRGASRASLKGREGASTVATLTDALTTFSLWSHLIGVITNWILTMDLFFLGVFQHPAREIGLYSAVLKLANFTTAVPQALTNLFQVWIGRRQVGVHSGLDESKLLRRYSLYLAAGTFAQAAFLYALAPYLIGFLSRGRWTSDEQARMLRWLAWILTGGAFFSSTLLASAWLVVRRKADAFFRQVYLPWLVVALVVYATAACLAGPDVIARANVLVALSYLPLILIFARRR